MLKFYQKHVISIQSLLNLLLQKQIHIPEVSQNYKKLSSNWISYSILNLNFLNLNTIGKLSSLVTLATFQVFNSLPSVAGGDHIRQPKQSTFPSFQKVLLDSTTLYKV